jgi:hypothetical protein
MRTLRPLLLSAALVAAATASQAANFGNVVFEALGPGAGVACPDVISPCTAFDFGGARSDMADATVTTNDYNGAATLPAGLPVNYSFAVARDLEMVPDRTRFELFFFTFDPASTTSPTANIYFVATPGSDFDHFHFEIFKKDGNNYFKLFREDSPRYAGTSAHLDVDGQYML